MAAPDERAAVEAATNYLAAHAHEPVPVDEVAGRVGYSPSHLRRLFARVSRTSPNGYHAAVRVEAAKQLLAGTTLSVLEVCHRVGYDSLGTFTRRFGAAVGVSPTGFRAVAAKPPPQPYVRAPITSRGGEVRGVVRLPAGWAVAETPTIWLGLFPRPLPVGSPYAGAMLRGPGPFVIPVPVPTCWILAATVVRRPGRASGRPRLLVAQIDRPVEVGDDLVLELRPWQRHEHPVTIGLPGLLVPDGRSGA